MSPEERQTKMKQLEKEGLIAIDGDGYPFVTEAGKVHFLTQRMQIHEKNAWMLRSLLEN
jgi:Mn-dependent DtxR family transcriptional regulator